MRKQLQILVLILLTSPSIFSQNSNYIILNPSIDNTIYQSNVGSLSNGQGELLFCGLDSNNQKRRTLIKFDLSSIPVNSVVTYVNLDIRGILGNTTQTVTIHRLTKDWGEGNSDAGLHGSVGTNAMLNDATWTHNFYNTSSWTSLGGDYVQIASDTATNLGNSSPMNFNSQQLLSDLQFFVDNPSQNFGWIIIGNETSSNSMIGFHSKQSSIFQLQPELALNYNTSTGVLENSEKESIYLRNNPVFDQIILESNFKNLRYSILNLKGGLIQNGSVNSNNINVSNLAEGIYLLQLSNENDIVKSVKFIKNKR